MATRPYSGTFEFFHFLISWSKIWVVGGLHGSRMFKKFVLALKKDLKSFLIPQPILRTSIEPHNIESKKSEKCP